MKLVDILEGLPTFFDKKDVNSLNKTPKKLKKGVYGGLGFAHETGCPAIDGNGGCTCATAASGGHGASAVSTGGMGASAGAGASGAAGGSGAGGAGGGK